LDLVSKFTDAQLEAMVPTVLGDASASVIFAGRVGHATQHMTSVEEGLRQGI
jgi:hypothetical protein